MLTIAQYSQRATFSKLIITKEIIYQNEKVQINERNNRCDGFILYRIEALMDFSDVKTGDKGGFVQSENNLSQLGNAWVYGNAKVCGNAFVTGNAEVCGNASVCGNAKVCGNASVCGNAKVLRVF